MWFIDARAVCLSKLFVRDKLHKRTPRACYCLSIYWKSFHVLGEAVFGGGAVPKTYALPPAYPELAPAKFFPFKNAHYNSYL